jgi:septal ring-binding cell division protein DamX
MDFEPHNFPALVTSVIRSDPRLAEPLREMFAAYARNEDLEEIWARIDSKFHHSLRLILDDLNEIDDPVSLDQEVQVLLLAIDEALVTVEVEAAIVPQSEVEETSVKTANKKAKKPAAKKAKAARKPAGKKKAAKKPAAKKKAAKKAPAGKKKKTAKAAKKKVAKKAAKPARKKAGKGAAKKPARKSAASKKSKPARKKKK